MLFILLLYIKLSILHLCVSDLGYQCKKEKNAEIFLVQDNSNELTRRFNDRFHSACGFYYTISYVYLENVDYNNNVIYFAVPDYYDGKQISENLEYAGDINSTTKTVCRETNKTEPKFDCNEIAKFVSKPVLSISDGDLYEYVQEMQVYGENNDIRIRRSCAPFNQKTKDIKTVLLCVSENKMSQEVSIEPLKVIVTTNDYCKAYFNGVIDFIAVLAPKPLKDMSFEYSVPAVFYEAQYMSSEDKAVFPNSMNLLPWRLLKYGFLKFLQTVGWQRVAIVTDDTEYSIEFENELTTLFNKERISYKVIRCEDATCDMGKVTRELRNVRAQIAIANVDEINAGYLFKFAHRPITWIVKDMDEHRRVIPDKMEVFSISLATVNKTNDCDVDSNILTGLSSIAMGYNNIPAMIFSLNKRQFYRYFAESIKHKYNTRKTEAIVSVKRLTSSKSEEISKMYIDEAGAQIIHLKNPFKSGKPDDGPPVCLARSYNYMDPCEDILVLLLMFVIILFSTTFLMITCYFDKTSPFNDIRYQNF